MDSNNYKDNLLQFFLFASLGLLVFLSLYMLMPHVNAKKAVPPVQFSVAEAFMHVELMAQKPHYVGSREHANVADYIIEEFRLMGLEVHIQEAYTVSEDYGVLTKPKNIIVRLPGTNPKPGSDLLILSHYDSAMHSAVGAADDGAGVAVLLQGIKTFLAQGKSHKNNIIVCITDAEEIGLIGAVLFANEPEWVKDVGLVLNFEARGTSGPSNTIVETNHGNSNMIKAYAAASAEFPMATSLAYELWKLMPNDTDATIFRVEKDIPGFFFAFTGNHFHYHTAIDNPENLNKNSLAHHGSYLMALLPYLGNYDLNELKTEDNRIFFYFPFLKLIHYSYGWIFPLLFLGWLLFLVILYSGFRQKQFTPGAAGRGFVGFLTAFGGCFVLGHFGWKAVMHFYPQYKEIMQGSPYNETEYILGFSFLGLSLIFAVYHFLRLKEKALSLMIAPLFLWLIINTFLAFKFKGASYFIVPVLFMELAFLVALLQKKKAFLIPLICSIPAIFIFMPLIDQVPQLMGTKMVLGSLILIVLAFGLILPIISFFSRKGFMAILFLIGGIFFIWKAHLNSGFTEKHPKPNSLVYTLDLDQNKANWLTYDHILDDWTGKYISGTQRAVDVSDAPPNKYGAGFTYSEEASVKEIPGSLIEIEKDSVVNGRVNCRLNIIPQRKLNQVFLFSELGNEFENIKVQGLPMRDPKDRKAKAQREVSDEDIRLLAYYPVNQDTLKLQFDLPAGIQPEIRLYSASNDLPESPIFGIQPRAKNMIPRPFVLNDAIVTKQVIKL